MAEPLPPLLSGIDIARQSTQQAGFAAVLKALAALSQKADALMSQDATVAAEAADIDAQAGKISTALGSVQSLLVQLQSEVAAGTANLSQATLDALAKAQQDVDTLSTQAQADVTADTPPSAAPAS